MTNGTVVTELQLARDVATKIRLAWHLAVKCTHCKTYIYSNSSKIWLQNSEHTYINFKDCNKSKGTISRN
jgi:hypothetical protein